MNKLKCGPVTDASSRNEPVAIRVTAGPKYCPALLAALRKKFVTHRLLRPVNPFTYRSAVSDDIYAVVVERHLEDLLTPPYSLTVSVANNGWLKRFMEACR